MSSRIAIVGARVLSALNALVWLALGYALHTGAPWTVALWPWPEVRMSFVFLASITASIGAVWLATACKGELAALAGVGVNTAVVGAGAAAYLWLFPANAALSAPVDAVAQGLALASLVLGLLLYVWAARQPLRDPRPMPRLVRSTFGLFVVVLVVAGTALALQFQVFPWPLRPPSATLFGIIFLGAAAYFAHAVLHPRWAHAAPPLWGFLAYDLVLFLPYARLLAGDAGDAAITDDYGGSTAQVNLTSLAIYLAVLASSTVLALYCFLLCPATRLRWPRHPRPAA